MPMQSVHECFVSSPTSISYCLQETGKESGNTTLGVYVSLCVMVVYLFTHHPYIYRLVYGLLCLYNPCLMSHNAYSLRYVSICALYVVICTYNQLLYHYTRHFGTLTHHLCAHTIGIPLGIPSNHVAIVFCVRWNAHFLQQQGTQVSTWPLWPSYGKLYPISCDILRISRIYSTYTLHTHSVCMLYASKHPHECFLYGI